MRLHAYDIMHRTIERGYAWEDVLPCLVADLGNGWYDVNVDHPAYPRVARGGASPPSCCIGELVDSALDAAGLEKDRSRGPSAGDAASEPKPTGLGDMIAAGLSAVGITKQRVQALASRVGIKDCGCSKRQKAANELGRKYLGIGGPKPP